MRKTEETQRISHFINACFYSLSPPLLREKWQDATEGYTFKYLLKKTQEMHGRTHITHTHITHTLLGTSALVKVTCKALRCSATSSWDRCRLPSVPVELTMHFWIRKHHSTKWLCWGCMYVCCSWALLLQETWDNMEEHAVLGKVHFLHK